MRDGNGEIVGLLGVTWVETERKRAEEELHSLQREYEELVDSVDAIIWKGEARPLRFTFVSHQAETILGYPVERWLAEPSFWSEHIHAEDREWAVSFCQRAIEDKRCHTFEYRMIGAGGEVVWLRDIVHVAVEGGVPKQLFGVMIDVTEGKEAERRLRESEDRFRSLCDATFEGVAIIENGKILEANRALAEMFGYELSEICGMSALELKVPEVRDEVWRKMSSGFSEPYESVGLKKNGTTFDIEIRGRTAWYGDRSVRVTAIRDITERKETEEKLRESEERSRGAFEDAPIGVALVDLDGRRFRVNRALCEMLGHSEEELLSKDYLEHIHPDDREISLKHLRETLEKGGR